MKDPGQILHERSRLRVMESIDSHDAQPQPRHIDQVDASGGNSRGMRASLQFLQTFPVSIEFEPSRNASRWARKQRPSTVPVVEEPSWMGTIED